MEIGMRPIGYASHPSMSYRVPMDVIHVTVEVSLITDEMRGLPEAFPISIVSRPRPGVLNKGIGIETAFQVVSILIG